MTKANRLTLILSLSILAQLFIGVGISHAIDTEVIADKTMTLRYRQSVAANTSTAAVLIDLSDTINYPHKEKGAINITGIRLEFDKAAASTATAKIGVVNFVNVATGSITWFYGKENNLNVSNTNLADPLNVQPLYIKTRVQPSTTANTDGSTTFMISNDTTSGDTTYQTDVTLPSPRTAGAAPGRGDIILFVQTGAATVVVQVELQYHSEP